MQIHGWGRRGGEVGRMGMFPVHRYEHVERWRDVDVVGFGSPQKNGWGQAMWYHSFKAPLTYHTHTLLVKMGPHLRIRINKSEEQGG